ncbi:LysR family transcriptional regulator [Sphingomonas crocodyli]|uniref:LysR family transcriptional regulator n=1 Tax=Sphingomonas crocodyli TaxID=1979270 RepID=A0A437M0B5_9SPHN|nr:LysR family transcriptional regulator [Sphingomonas crocodyli]RVT91127.1 LysR family transcriptional regulator [Sphingomonas crocodyli]
MPAFSRFLRYFMVVGRTGSIRRAAEILNVSASAIDRQILQAEAELGARLFERLPTGLRLTAAGEQMMAAGGRWQKGLEDVRASIDDLTGLRRGHVDIALIDALARGTIPRIVRAIRDEHPGITIGLSVLDNANVQGAIESGAADFGLLLEPRSGRNLAVRAHAEVVLGFVTRPDHRLATGKPTRFAACVGEPVVVPAEPLALCQQVQALEVASGVPIEIAARADNIQMLKSLVIEGVGIGLLTSLDVASEVAAGDLAFVPIVDATVRPLTLGLCVVPARSLSHAANLVLTRIEADFGTIGSGATLG